MSAPWPIHRLGDLTEKPEYGLTASANLNNVGPKFIRITDITESGVDWTSVPYCECSPDDYEKVKVHSGDLLVARIGATTGKAFLIREPVDAVFASYLIRIRAMGQLDPEFLYFFMRSQDYWAQIDAVKGGRLKGGVNIPTLQNLEIPLPPLEEQRAIAEVLQAAQDVSRAFAAQKRTLKKLRASTLDSYMRPLSGDLVESTDIGTLPKGWAAVPIESCGAVVTGSTPPTSQPEYYGGEIPFFSPGDIGDLPKLKKASKTLTRLGLEKTRELPKGSVTVVCIGATIGKVGIIEVDRAATNQQCNTIIPNPHKIDNVFLYYALIYRAPSLPDLAGRAAIPIVNKSNFASFKIPLPPLEIQKAIAQTMMSIDNMIESVENEELAATSLFHSLLHNLMTGQVRIPEFATKGQGGSP